MPQTSSHSRPKSPLEPGLVAKTVAELPARLKLEELLRVAKGKRRGLILTHDNPDPDSIAAGIALAHLLERKTGMDVRAGYGGIIGRAENIALVKVLKLPIVPVSQVVFSEYDFLALVDTQPSIGNHALPARYIADAVVDHHPLRTDSIYSPFADVGGDFGATSTMLVEYLRAAKLEPSVEVATALFYGIKTDSRDLGRQTTDADIDSYLWLFPRVDKQLLARIEHPDLPPQYFRLYQTAFERSLVYGSAIVADLEEVYSPDMVAEVAERLLSLEGMKWSLAYGTYRGQLYFSLRTRDRRMNAGRLIREICSDWGGSAGGHGSMAGARLPLPQRRAQALAMKRKLLRRFLQGFGAMAEAPVPLLHMEPA
jgi:nanoRNase/pAp phosphatase (c-di-AMP/oligoRNAs hydrolase)